MEKDELADLLWRIYLKSCVCSMDYFTECQCEANDIVSEELQKLLGDNWHSIMRSRS